MKISEVAKEILKDTGSTYFFLLKIMIPISIIVKILSQYGIVEKIGNILGPAMGIVGLPGEFGLVWATAMVTNIYGSLIVLFQLSINNVYTVAQVTVLGLMILVAHTLPIEARIAQKAGVRLWFTLSWRIGCALLFGVILNFIFTFFNLFQEKSSMIWKPGNTDPTLTQWISDQIIYYIIIFLIILGLMTLMTILKKSGLIERMNKTLRKILEFFGMSKEAAPITIVGMTLGLAYGGGLIVKEARSKGFAKKDTFLSLALMGLTHSLIEDTLLILTIGATLFGILFGRTLLTIILMLILLKIINHLSNKTFERYLINS